MHALSLTPSSTASPTASHTQPLNANMRHNHQNYLPDQIQNNSTPRHAPRNGPSAPLSNATSVRSPVISAEGHWRHQVPVNAHHGYKEQEDSVELVNYQKNAMNAEDEMDEDGEYLDEIYMIIDAIVPRTDDSSLPALTFRVWFLGLIFGALICAINTLFTFRTNQVLITPFITVLLAYPIGMFMAKFLPFGVLNPGSFNYKEHALIYVICSCMSSTPYALYNIIGQKYQLYQDDLKLISCFCFALVTQVFGYGFAGLTRRYLVRPAAMLWPSNFATIAMLNSLHGKDDLSKGRYPMSRFKFFWLAASAMFFFTFLPQYVAPMLGAVSILCLAFRSSTDANTRKIALALGSSSPGAGMGFLSITFDWSLYTSVYFPITTPLWAILNQFIGSYLLLWIVVPLCWWFNAFGGDRLVGADTIYGFALNSPYLYDKNGSYVDNRNLVMQDPSNTANLMLNQQFYDSLKPFYITTAFAMQYVTAFVVFVAAIVHVSLWYGRDIWHRFRATMRDLDSEDIHAQLMDVYPDVPDWWYYSILLVTAVMGIAVCQFGGFDLPWWGVILAILLALVSMIPIGVIQAISGQQIGLNVMSEFLIGLLLPGRIAAVMAFKTFSYMAMYQGLLLVQDLKLGHYVKIPPRAMFLCQLVSTVIGALISTAVGCGVYESFGKKTVPVSPMHPLGFVWKIQLLATDEPNSGWNSAGYDTFLSAGAIWGAIGPARFFGPESPYFKTLLGFAFGLILPVIPWMMHKVQPDGPWHLINIPLLTIMPIQPNAQQSNLIAPLVVAIIVNYFIKKYRHTWWKKYAYVMSAAFDAGSTLSILFIFFMAKYQTSYLLPFPTWFLNPADTERCLPDSVLNCLSHETMGNGFGNKYDATQDPECSG
ncbi:OPT oligopeptide transporter protein-domain-containing protein [Chytriomyces cf. hyalinus JEL632]|nr:OPT oligopeptide transporter protein-domain-containing protein [Chytriomyces cf. hyalinus JEL632]